MSPELDSLPRGRSCSFQSFTPQKFTLMGDSYLRNGYIGLTRAVELATSIVGALIWNDCNSIFDKGNNVNPNSYGDRLALFLSSSNQHMIIVIKLVTLNIE